MELIVAALPLSSTYIIYDEEPFEDAQASEVEASDRITLAKHVHSPL